MNPFTQFLGRLVELLGAEAAAQLVREFAGQTLQFPITDHYGFSSDAAVLGAGYVPRTTSHIAPQLQSELLHSSAPATQPRGARLLALAHELGRSSQALQRYAALIEQARSTVLEEIEDQQRELVGS